MRPARSLMLMRVLSGAIALISLTAVASARFPHGIGAACSVSLNFSQPCNMMYLGLGLR